MYTIFALSTPPGKSGVAVIRVSGPAAKDALRAFGVTLPAARLATLAKLHINNNSLDYLPLDGGGRHAEAQARRQTGGGDVTPHPNPPPQGGRKSYGAVESSSTPPIIDHSLVLFFPAPHSFTGEDIVEYHVHGSRAVVKAVLAALATLPGLRPAEPGEFARRAFLNGKMDLTAAEGLADLIDSETESQRKQALSLMQGDAARFYEALRADLLSALAALEAYIDFPDEEIPSEVLAEIEKTVRDAKFAVERQLAGAAASERIRDGVQVAILGPPNAGKSSLLNWLARRDASIVSDEAGTTRDVIEVHLDIAGYAVTVCDTAGLREKAGGVEQEGIRRALARAEKADIKIVMLDGENVSRETLEVTRLVDSTTLLILNKSDCGIPSPLPVIGGVTPLPVSVKTGAGMEALMDALSARVEASCPPEASFVTEARHRTHLEATLAHLANYMSSKTALLELRCEELRRAGAEIGKITGVIAVEELLGHIFSRFCIGK